MKAADLLQQLQDLLERFPNAAHREVMVMADVGTARQRVDEVLLSATETVWIMSRKAK